MKQKSTFERAYEVVRRIPRGKVATYGDVARRMGNPRWSRVVGYALHVNPEPGVIPCHRVVNRFGETSRAFAFGGEDMQRTLLEEEGVTFLPDGRVDLDKHRWSEENEP
ncbi:MAG: MGMT family protein [Ruminococcus sp.]|nr:MGMT family protein [Ruminococcus sp.]